MSHHGSKGESPGISPEMLELLGATKKFPEGKMNEHDEGEIRFAITADKERNVVHINFGGPVVWVSLNKSQALEIADVLRRNAEEL